MGIELEKMYHTLNLQNRVQELLHGVQVMRISNAALSLSCQTHVLYKTR